MVCFVAVLIACISGTPQEDLEEPTKHAQLCATIKKDAVKEPGYDQNGSRVGSRGAQEHNGQITSLLELSPSPKS